MKGTERGRKAGKHVSRQARRDRGRKEVQAGGQDGRSKAGNAGPQAVGMQKGRHKHGMGGRHKETKWKAGKQDERHIQVDRKEGRQAGRQEERQTG